MTQPTLNAVLQQLTEEGLLSDDEQAAADTAIAQPKTHPKSPWFIHVFIAIGAWLAAVFLMAAVAFFIVLGSVSSSSLSFILIFIGLLFSIGAIGLRRAQPASIFALNLALALSLAGQALVLSGIYVETNNITLTALAAIFMEALLIWFYPDRLHRFLSSLAITGAVLTLLAEWDFQEAIHLLLWIFALGTAFFWENESFFAPKNTEAVMRPIGYALPVSLLGLLILSIVRDWDLWPATWWVTTLGLLIILFGWEYFSLAQYNQHKNLLRVLAVLGGTALALLPTLPAPGIAAALLVLLIGFRRGNRGLLGLAIGFLVIFVIAFYYNLELTLLWKSIILITTGSVCLALRFILVRRSQPSEAAS